MISDFLVVEDEPVAERRVVVTPDESPTSGKMDENSLGLCRRCGHGQTYLLKFGNGDSDVRCDRCFGKIRHVRSDYTRG